MRNYVIVLKLCRGIKALFKYLNDRFGTCKFLYHLVTIYQKSFYG